MSMPSLSPLSFFFSTAPTATPFTLSSSFVESYRTKTTSFGFNGLGEVVYQRTYSRMMTDGTTPEQWFQTVARVVNGTYNMQKKWIDERQLGWDEGKAQASAQRMYELMFDMKFLPPGRGLWAMGSPITEERSLYAALNNCAFVSTGDAQQEPSSPFCFLMVASL